MPGDSLGEVQALYSCEPGVHLAVVVGRAVSVVEQACCSSENTILSWARAWLSIVEHSGVDDRAVRQITDERWL